MAGAGKGAVTTGNISLDIKYVFMSFAQQFFATHSKYTWNSELLKTKLVIVDKNAVDLEIVEKRPAIIVSRGSMAWTNTNPGQRGVEESFFAPGNLTFPTLAGGVTADTEKNAVYTDLMQCTVTFHVVSKSGIQAEEIASDLFSALTVYKSELRLKGVHKVNTLSYGEEQMLRSNASIEYATVPLSVSFVMQKTLRRGEISNNCRVYLNGEEIYENIHWVMTNNGTGLELHDAPAAGSTLTITYVDSNTIQTYTNITLGGAINGVNTTYGLPDDGATSVLGYYSMLEAVNIMDKSPDTGYTVPSGGMSYPPSGVWIGA